MDAYYGYMSRLVQGDFSAIFNGTISSMVVQSLLHVVPAHIPDDLHLRTCAEFLASDHFKEAPYQWLQAHMFSTFLRTSGQGTPATNRDRAVEKLSGFVFDVKHIATYAPYVDAIVLDKQMAALVALPTVALESRYGSRVFSLKNWAELLDWLHRIEAEGMTESHRAGLAAAYPGHA